MLSVLSVWHSEYCLALEGFQWSVGDLITFTYSLKCLGLVSLTTPSQLYVHREMFGLKCAWEERRHDSLSGNQLDMPSGMRIKSKCVVAGRSVVRNVPRERCDDFFTVGINSNCSRVLFSFLLCLLCRSLLFFLCATLWSRIHRMCWGELREVVTLMAGLGYVFILCAHFLCLV